MFDATIDPGKGMQTRFSLGAILSIAVHAAVAALVLAIPSKAPSKPIEEQRDPLFVEFVPRVQPATEVPKSVQENTERQAPKVAPRHKDAPVPISDEIKPQQKTQENPSAHVDKPPGETPSSGTTADPVGLADSGGALGATAAVDKAPAIQPLEAPSAPKEYRMTHDMKPPVLLSGPGQPAYPRQALQLRREGSVVARCRITAEGHVRDCRILRGDDMLRDGVLETLAKQRYRPVMLDGRAVNVSYDFRFHFKVQ